MEVPIASGRSFKPRDRDVFRHFLLGGGLFDHLAKHYDYKRNARENALINRMLNFQQEDELSYNLVHSEQERLLIKLFMNH